MSLIFVINLALPNFSNDFQDPSVVVEKGITDREHLLESNNPIALLVGINGSELSYHEISNLSGIELFSVPYRSDLMLLIEQIKPSQVIIRHPSGFVGLYSVQGQLIRGVQTTGGSQQVANFPGVPPSIIQPTEANPVYENVYYPGSVTGAIPHGGLGYTTPPKGRGVFRHLLKLLSFGTMYPYQYPGFPNSGFNLNQDKLFPSLITTGIPTGISAAASIIDSKFDASDYEEARAQPRDYMFQPVIEGY